MSEHGADYPFEFEHAIFGRWAIVHKASQRKLGMPFRSLNNAISAADALTEIKSIDWYGSLDGVTFGQWKEIERQLEAK